MAEVSVGSQVADQVRQPTGSPSIGLRSQLIPTEEEDAERLRGVVALSHERATLFTDEVELDAEKLPRWQPHIRVDERRLIDDDHE